MSEFVKNLLMDNLEGAAGTGSMVCCWCRCNGLERKRRTALLRKQSASKKIKMSWSRTAWPVGQPRARPWPPRSRSTEGSLAAIWVARDIVSLAKGMSSSWLTTSSSPRSHPKGGVMTAGLVGATRCVRLASGPAEQEQLSILLGQILAPGANLREPIDQRGRGIWQRNQAEGEGEEAAAGGTPQPASDFHFTRSFPS